MTIKHVAPMPVGELLGSSLRVPPYQRPYMWEPATALQLINDIADAWRDESRRDVPYVIGAVILHREHDQVLNNEVLNIVDGQQRLLTLTMILKILDGVDGSPFTRNPTNSVARVWKALSQRIKSLVKDHPQVGELKKFITSACQFVKVETDNLDEAFRVFDSQNYRGKPLAPHDLLKAHHLREMRGESDAMIAAIVEDWQAVLDKDLDRLFSTFLYRIARWTRGQSALTFTAQDIGMFKGISRTRAVAPSVRYHLVAQAAVPMLSDLAYSNREADVRDLMRTRFQLDAPNPAGRGFFEMVKFMLEELEKLRWVAFEEGWKKFASYRPVDPDKRLEGSEIFAEMPSRSKYRYVSELYIAALLYFTNKFGSGTEFNAAKIRLFTWAFTPRVEQERVQYRTIDKRGRGAEGTASAFVELRNSSLAQALYGLPSSNEQAYGDPSQEADLSELLENLGTL
jgi:hypothetical protein